MNAQPSNLAQNTVEPSVAPIARMQAFADAGKVPARSAERFIRARWAVSLLFLVYGLVFGTWAPMMPSLQDKFHLSAGQLSWVLLGMITGSMISMPLTGKLIGYWGSGRLGGPAAPIFAATLLGIAFAPSYGALIAAAVFFGPLYDDSLRPYSRSRSRACVRPDKITDITQAVVP